MAESVRIVRIHNHRCSMENKLVRRVIPVAEDGVFVLETLLCPETRTELEIVSWEMTNSA